MSSITNTKEIDGVQYVSSKEMISKGFFINPFASLNKDNKAVFKDGEMIDLLVPEKDIDTNFKKEN